MELSQVDLVAWRRHRSRPSIIEQPGRHVPGRVLAAQNNDVSHAAQGVAWGQLASQFLAPAPAGWLGRQSVVAGTTAYSRDGRSLPGAEEATGGVGPRAGRRARSTSAATGMAIGTE